MSTLTFNAARNAQSTAVSTFPFQASPWPAARVKSIARRIVQLTAICLVLVSIPDDSGPARPHAATTSQIQSVLHLLTNADR